MVKKLSRETANVIWNGEAMMAKTDWMTANVTQTMNAQPVLVKVLLNRLDTRQ